MINLGDEFPNFRAETTVGPINFHEWMGNSWAMLFSHPADYTPVCTTELGKAADLFPEFEKLGVKIIALSCNSVASHQGWIRDIQSYCSMFGGFPYPIIADEKRELAIKLGMLDPVEKDSEGLPLTCRALFIIGPDKKLKLSMLYPATTGRSFPEMFRVIQSLQLTETKQVATPANWMPGEPCMVLPTVKDEDIPQLFPQGVTVHPVPSGHNYLRMTPHPK